MLGTLKAHTVVVAYHFDPTDEDEISTSIKIKEGKIILKTALEPDQILDPTSKKDYAILKENLAKAREVHLKLQEKSVQRLEAIDLIENFVKDLPFQVGEG